MSYLLDTNVLSELRRASPNAAVARWRTANEGADLFVSVLLLGEIRRGIASLEGRDPTRAAAYERWLETLQRTFAARVLPVDGAVADRWGRMNAVRPLPVVDGLMAATAIVHDLTFVTRNVRDVESTGARLLNPWDTP